MQTTALKNRPDRTDAPRAIDEQKLHDLLGRAIVDFGAVRIAPLVLIGDRSGLYRALAEHGALDVDRARRAHRNQRALRARVAQRAGRIAAT